MSVSMGEVLVVLHGGLDTSGRIVTDPVLIAAEHVARAWLQIKASAGHALDRGLGLRQLMNADLSFSDRRRIEGDAAREARRVNMVTQALVSSRDEGGAFVLTGKITISSGQSFTLTLSSAGTAEVS